MGERCFVKGRFPQRFQVCRIEDRAVTDEVVRQTAQTAFALFIGIVRLFQRVNEAAEIIIRIVAHVGRHLGVAEIGFLTAVGAGAQGTNEMSFTRTRLADEQQHARLDGGLRAARAAFAILALVLRFPGDGSEHIGELAARFGMHLLDVHGIGPPDIVFPGNGMLEGVSQTLAGHAMCLVCCVQNRVPRRVRHRPI